ncbi:DUF3472 domain-containing protein [Salinibacter altiplanensis]|uniref:DUF3472 domain-containing protein n=1 Tax=Salinibacter altiplanensis TaxID=1803181 RepID=UPI000C9FD10B|nr:DUF3472 domain-containing protein [Salinibacter altiplanensis]
MRRFAHKRTVLAVTGLLALASLGCDSSTEKGSGGRESSDRTETVSVPLGGNAYLTSGGGPDAVTQEGITTWKNSGSTFSVFVKLRTPTVVRPRLRARAPEGEESTVRLRVDGYEEEARVTDSDYSSVAFGETEIEESGYVRFDLTGVEKTGDEFVEATDLKLEVPRGTTVHAVRSNEDNAFYWSRRGPSVHLNYGMPDATVEWVHSAITVPEGKDPVGAYYMANGFNEGYFGIQVNAEAERRVLFSVWSPHDTDDPSSIPDSLRVQLVAKGDNVTANEFGGEGSGGQSHLTYSWETGTPYRFLTRAVPDGDGNTIYTAYFYPPEEGKWRLLASFKRPQTDTWYKGWYSFLENFDPGMGYVERKAYYHDHWARDTDGTWHAIEQATFTGDGTARSGLRQDFAGGVEEEGFYLRHCGFFDDSVSLGQTFGDLASGRQPPSVNVDALSR